eukprot:SAG31_NODE_33258_length_345_cov_22.808943_1_plen_72_part_01
MAQPGPDAQTETRGKIALLDKKQLKDLGSRLLSWKTVKQIHKDILTKMCVRDDAWVAETVKTQRSVTEEEQY